MSKTGSSSSNEYEADKPGTAARDVAEASIERLRQEGGVFVQAIRATRMAMVITDPNLPGNPIVFANRSFLEVSGYTMEEVLGQQPFFMNGPGTDPEDARRFREALAEDRDALIETVQYAKDGTYFVAIVLLSAFKDESGHTLHHFLSWADVTRRFVAEKDLAALQATEAALRQSEQRANLLLAELQHRVRNTLSVVRSIARRTAEQSEDVDQLISHFEGRLNAFSRVQSAVTRAPGTGIDLTTIVEDELLAVATREGEQLQIKGPELHLQPRSAEAISLAIHELATNAVKYGALSADRGRIRVTWNRVSSGSGDEALEFEWDESGLEDAPKPSADGFGLEMLKRSLPYELGAETQIEFTGDGLRFTMSLPLTSNVLAEKT